MPPTLLSFADRRRLEEAFATSGSGIDEYDVGDSWEHQLLVETTDVPVAASGVATCTAGERACPPEDCGGALGCAHLLGALADPTHREHDEVLEWLGGDVDPELFEKGAVNAALARIPFP